jgi:hypothetical protein
LAFSGLLKRILLYLVAGVLITVISIILAGMLNGAFHSMTASTVFFPFATLVLQHTRWETLATVLIALQFQVYAVLLAVIDREQRGPIMLVVATVHVAAVIIGLTSK